MENDEPYIKELDLILQDIKRNFIYEQFDPVELDNLIQKGKLISEELFGNENHFYEDMDSIDFLTTSYIDRDMLETYWTSAYQVIGNFHNIIAQMKYELERKRLHTRNEKLSSLKSNDDKKIEIRLPNKIAKSVLDRNRLRRVWVIHGRNIKLVQDVFSFLRAIGLDPIEWEEARARTGISSPYISDILEAGFEYAQAFVVLLTGDDEAKMRDIYTKKDDPDYEHELTPQARPNVLFEAGMAFGRNSKQTVFVQHGEIRPFTDIAGIHILSLNNSPASRQEFANRLRDAGCEITDLSNKKDWFTVGNFS